MKLRILLLTVFALINAIVLYLFLLQLPFGQESFLLSLAYWGRLSTSSVLAMAIGLGTAVLGLIAAGWLDDNWKYRLVYLHWHHPHPARNAFLVNRRQPFGQADLLVRYPQVKDSGFDPQVQIDTWEEAYRRYPEHQVIVDTTRQWTLMRDLYLISIAFLAVFLLSWILMYPVPFAVVSSHIFIFGAQAMFLSLMARRVGFRLVDNLLGVSLGVDEDAKSEGEPRRRSPRKRKM